MADESQPNDFEAPEVWRPRGRGFSMGAVQPEGKVIHLTGQVAWDANEEVVGVGDVEAQTRKIFDNIERLLAVVGGRLDDIVSTTTWYTDPAQLPFIQKVRADVFDRPPRPVSTSIMVAGLGHPDFLVEITPVAVVPCQRFISPSCETLR